MILSHAHKFIYFANPKTGSQKIREVLNPFLERCDIVGGPFLKKGDSPFYGHMTPREMREAFGQRGWDFDGYYRFTTTRNPFARLVSTYNYRYGKPSRGWRGAVRKLTGEVPTFRAWVRTVDIDGNGGGGNPDQRWLRYGTYTTWNFIACEDRRVPLVDRVLRLEDLQTQLVPVLKRIGLPVTTVDLEPVNARGHRHYTDYYDRSTRDYVSRKWADDMETYGYTFGE